MAAETTDSAVQRLRSAPSIPSKFETVLHFGQQEQDAFWSRTPRFVQRTNMLPGPGAYPQEGTIGKVPPSIGKKGYGTGFVSKVKRFSPPPLFRPPGPGSYTVSSFVDNVKKPGPASKPSPSFVPRVVSAPASLGEENLLPGPGAYDADDTKVGKAAKYDKKLNATFQSRIERFADAHHKLDLPAPGQYEVSQALQSMDKTRAKMPSCSFKSRTLRTLGLPTEDQIVDSKKDDLTEFRPTAIPATSLGVDLPRSPGRKHVRPGPGQYDNPVAAIVTKDGHRVSSMFNVGNNDRFGRVLQPLKPHQTVIPGPGAYNVDADNKAKSLVSSSFFMSASDKNIIGAFNPHQARPGPAYYTPAEVSKKSFHLNIARKWV